MQVPIDSNLQRFIHTTLYLHLFSHLVQYSFTQLSPEPDLPRWVLLQQHRRHFGLEKVPDVPGLEKKQLHIPSSLSVQIATNAFQRVYYIM